jgi:hypothetical protein
MSGEGGPVVRMVLLGLGVVLLDYSSQAAINPCEALMSDMMAEVRRLCLIISVSSFSLSFSIPLALSWSTCLFLSRLILFIFFDHFNFFKLLFRFYSSSQKQDEMC